MCEEFNLMSASEMSNVKRTAELKMALRSFLAQCGASCYQDENNEDILKCYSRLQNGMCVEQEIHVGDSDYVCYTNLSGGMKDSKSEAITDLIRAVNGVNIQLKYGNFEVNEEKGTIRFRSYYEPGQEIRVEEMDRLVGEPLWAVESYGGQLLYGVY